MYAEDLFVAGADPDYLRHRTLIKFNTALLLKFLQNLRREILVFCYSIKNSNYLGTI